MAKRLLSVVITGTHNNEKGIYHVVALTEKSDVDIGFEIAKENNLDEVTNVSVIEISFSLATKFLASLGN